MTSIRTTPDGTHRTIMQSKPHVGTDDIMSLAIIMSVETDTDRVIIGSCDGQIMVGVYDYAAGEVKVRGRYGGSEIEPAWAHALRIIAQRNRDEFERRDGAIYYHALIQHP